MRKSIAGTYQTCSNTCATTAIDGKRSHVARQPPYVFERAHVLALRSAKMTPITALPIDRPSAMRENGWACYEEAICSVAICGVSLKGDVYICSEAVVPVAYDELCGAG